MATLTAAEAAERLGVKVPTIYAYVSRGVLPRARGSARHASRFRVADVEALALRGRPRRASRPSLFEVEISTSLTRIEGGRLAFRGHDAVTLARSATFEQAATLLWTGILPRRPPVWSGRPLELGADGDLAERLRVGVARAAVAHPARGDLGAPAVAATGAGLLASLVDALPVAGDGRAARLVLPDGGPAHRGTIAGRLWARLVPGRPRPPLVTALNAALVLLVDHEMAASTLAARVAASTRAGPHAVVMAGLGPLAGPLHGGASRAARAVLEAAAGPLGAERALEQWRRSSGHYPGFGHFLYEDGDPRATLLLDLLRQAAAGRRAMRTVEDVIGVVARRAGLRPNVDLALAALGHVTGMPPESGEVVFTVARSAGWLAHALEEYGEAPLRFRPRARYREP